MNKILKDIKYEFCRSIHDGVLTLAGGPNYGLLICLGWVL